MVKIVRRPLAEEIRDEFREQILSGQLVAGQRLTEQQVAKDMGTSQGPVREAFASLSQEGLLISLPHRGTFVASVSEAEARMAYALRGLIEPYAVELALPNLSDEVLAQLEADLETMQQTAAAGDVTQLAAADVQFHGRLYALAGTDVLASVWRTISATMRQFIVLVAPLYLPNLREGADDHIVLLDLLRARDLERLRAEVPVHVSNIWRRIGAATDQDEAGGSAAELPG